MFTTEEFSISHPLQEKTKWFYVPDEFMHELLGLDLLRFSIGWKRV